MMLQPNICVISLPNRGDRLQQFYLEINKLFSTPSVILIDGVVDLPVHKGIAQAHLNCVQYAKDNNLPYIIICEDDLKISDSLRLKEYVNNAFTSLPDDYNILLGGIYSSESLTHYNDYLNITSTFCGTHFYIINSNCYDKILSFDKTMHIDRWLASKANLKCYVVKEFFATQHNGFSDNVNNTVNYDNYLASFKLLK